MNKKLDLKKHVERTLVVFKHDGVARGIMGEIIQRFERVGLKIVAMEMLSATEDMADKHYASTPEVLARFGNHTLDTYKEKGIDPLERFGTNDPLEIGKVIKKWNINLLTRGPVLAMVLEGPEAIRIVRKLAGPTNPLEAPAGTIRGDYTWDNYDLANDGLRSVYNILHISGNKEEADFEISLWFDKSEIFEYENVHHKGMGYTG